MGARQSAEVTKALKLVERGMTAYAAAKKTGIHLNTIYNALRRHGVPARPPHPRKPKLITYTPADPSVDDAAE